MNRLLDNMTWAELVEHNIQQAQHAKINLDYPSFRKYLLELEPIGSCFDFALKARAFVIRTKLKKDYDHLIIVHGHEGWGKSTAAIQLAASIDFNFNLTRLCFDLVSIIDCIKTCEPGSAIVIDEGSINLFSREAMSKSNRILVKLMMIARQKNLCLIICIPNFFLLDDYLRSHRVDTLIAISERGKYYCYFGRGIRRIAQFGAKLKEVIGIRVSEETFFTGWFVKSFPKTIDSQEYARRKQAHLAQFISDLEQEREIVINYIPIKEMASMLNMTPEAMTYRVEKNKIPGKKILGRWYVDRKFFEMLKETMVKGENG